VTVPGDYGTIQDAIDNVSEGDVITVAPGTYNENLVIDDPGVSFTLRGSGAGVTFIDGGGTDTVIRIIDTGDCVVTIEGFTITNGYATSYDGSLENGGGMFCCEASPVVRDCVFYANHANDNGGGMFNGYLSAPTVIGCIFSENTAGTDLWDGDWGDVDWSEGDGAGMFNNGTSSPTVTNCQFIGNTAGWSGGGMKNGGFYELEESFLGATQGTPLITNCMFRDNIAGWSGGGMTNASTSSPYIQGCTFDNNISGYNAGGMKNSGQQGSSTPTIDGCIFSNNSTGWNGGGMKNGESSAPTVINCVFVGNEVVGRDFGEGIESGGGGGMKNGQNSTPLVINCTFYANSVTYASNCGNNDGANGGGVKNGQYTQAVYTNCIIWGNTPNNVLDSTYDTPEVNADTTITYSNVGGGYPGVGNINADPLFVNAPTDVSLQQGSPCIDAGTDMSPDVVDDILGVARPQGGAYDMGAYEFAIAASNWSPISIMPLARTQLALVTGEWNALSEQLPEEPSDEMTELIERIQAHMQNATGLANPIYASGELAKALSLMGELSALIV
jgi:hypothetical protein